MPNEDSLAATLFVPLPPDEDARVALRQLVGLDEHVILHIGTHAIRAAFEQGRSTEEKISAVQYARFPLSAGAKAVVPAATSEEAVRLTANLEKNLSMTSEFSVAS